MIRPCHRLHAWLLFPLFVLGIELLFATEELFWVAKYLEEVADLELFWEGRE
jgi:hypothetical protein